MSRNYPGSISQTFLEYFLRKLWRHHLTVLCGRSWVGMVFSGKRVISISVAIKSSKAQIEKVNGMIE